MLVGRAAGRSRSGLATGEPGQRGEVCEDLGLAMSLAPPRDFSKDSAMSTLNGIRNFLRIDDGLTTGGMPPVDDFAALRQAGFEVVINLALPPSDNALPNEGELVSAQGMTCVHISVKSVTLRRFGGRLEWGANLSIGGWRRCSPRLFARPGRRNIQLENVPSVATLRAP